MRFRPIKLVVPFLAIVVVVTVSCRRGTPTNAPDPLTTPIDVPGCYQPTLTYSATAIPDADPARIARPRYGPDHLS